MNPYEILGVSAEATPDEVKKAYRRLAAKTHPDVAGDVMAPLFRSVQRAYETLSDPVKRARYDRGTETAEHPQPDAGQDTPEPAYPRHEARGAPEHFPPASPPGRPAPKRRWGSRKARTWALVALFAGLVGYWLFQGVQLWQLVQPRDGLHLYTLPGVPAIVYAVLWAFGTIVASVAYDLATAVKTPLGCAAFAAGFAFITGVWTIESWVPALAAGLVLTLAVAVLVRVREAKPRWWR